MTDENGEVRKEIHMGKVKREGVEKQNKLYTCIPGKNPNSTKPAAIPRG